VTQGADGLRLRVASALRSGIPALTPLSWLYGVGVEAMRASRMVPRLGTQATPLVVAVGNLEVGGGGKTPLAIFLLDAFRAGGRRVGYASRGYGSRAAGGPMVTLVPHVGGVVTVAAGVRMVSREHEDLAGEIGDEGAVVAERAPAATLAFSADRVAAVDVLRDTGMDVVIVDDAFQTWRLARHVDVVLLDAARPVGSGRLLPAGTLREAPSALRRADLVVFNGVRDVGDVERACGEVKHWLRVDTRTAGVRRRIEVVRPGDDSAVPIRRAVVVCAIARPEGFARDVRGAGVEIGRALVFPDHHAFSAADASVIVAACDASGCRAIVVTEKDWVKLRRLDLGGVDVRVARLDIEWVGDPLPF
jgi:tetraacyldisaccharide 4'-kinase